MIKQVYFKNGKVFLPPLEIDTEVKIIPIDFTGVPQEDINKLVEKIKDEINYISSGGRDKSIYFEQLRKDLLEYGRDFGKQLKDKGIKIKNTNYSTWEYGTINYTIDIYYTLDYKKFNSKEDFRVFISDWRNGHYKSIGECKTVNEALKILDDNNIKWNYKD